MTYIHDKLEQQITVICENSTSGIVKTERMRSRLLLLHSPQRFRCTSLMEAFRKTWEKYNVNLCESKKVLDGSVVLVIS